MKAYATTFAQPPLFFWAFFLISLTARAEFVEVFEASQELSNSSSVCLGDYDNDGDQDVLLSGRRAHLLRNEGGGQFVEVEIDLVLEDETVTFGSQDAEKQARFADFNRDGRLDIVQTGMGQTGEAVTEFFINEGEKRFRPLLEWYPGLTRGALCVGDATGDGLPDVLITGRYERYQNDRFGTIILENLDGERFAKVDHGLPSAGGGPSYWADFDLDGRLDVVLMETGHATSRGMVEVFRQSDDRLRYVSLETEFRRREYGGHLSIADIDRNGATDIILTGEGKTDVYMNRGDGSFKIGESLKFPELYLSDVAWADFDGDGDVDGAMTDSGRLRLFHQDPSLFGSRLFEVTNEVITDEASRHVLRQGVAWFDYNNDGKLDLWAGLRLFENRFPNPPAAAPPTPEGLESSVSGNEVVLRWDAVEGKAVYYHVRAGSSVGADDLISARRLVANRGNAGTGTRFRLSLPADDEVFWSVQAVGVGGLASPFAAEASLSMDAASRELQVRSYLPLERASGLGQFGSEVNVIGRVQPDGGSTQVWVEWSSESLGDQRTESVEVDHEATVQFTLSGLPPLEVVRYRMVAESASTTAKGNMVEIETALLSHSGLDVFAGATASSGLLTVLGDWVDQDGDGYLDVLINTRAEEHPLVLSRNLEGKGFEALPTSLPPSDGTWPVWGDYNNDGMLDLLMTYRDSSDQRRTGLFRNEGEGAFTSIGAEFVPTQGLLGWFDYNQDGLQDVVLAGSSTSGRHFRIYRNAGQDVFLPAVDLPTEFWFYGRMEVADLDQNGLKDLIYIGETQEPYGSEIRILLNQGEGQFTERTVFRRTGEVYLEHLDLGDFDGDGGVDLLVSELRFVNSGFGEQWSTAVYRFGDDYSLERALGPTLGNACCGQWADFDGDGLLDVVMAGHRIQSFDFLPYAEVFLQALEVDRRRFRRMNVPLLAGGEVRSGATLLDYDRDGSIDWFNGVTLFRNNSEPLTERPPAPSDLTTAMNEGAVTFRWSADLAVPGTTFNLRLGTRPGGSEIMAPEASENGWLTLVRQGNVGGAREWTVTGLSESGTYYWSVQAVDPAYRGSIFSEEGTFTYVRPQTEPRAETLTILEPQQSPQAYGIGSHLTGLVDTGGLPTRVWFEWGEDETYGNTSGVVDLESGGLAVPIRESLDGLLGGKDYHYRLVAENALGRHHGANQRFSTALFEVVSVDFPPNAGEGTWMDVDGDGDLDMLVSGRDDEGPLMRLLLQDEHGEFAEQSTNLPVLDEAAFAWADADHDGDLDVAISGWADEGPWTDIYLNEGEGVFVGAQAGLEPVWGGALAWGDFDRDGRIDLGVSGRNGRDISVCHVYRNDRSGGFFDMGFELTGVYGGSLDWGDYDGDGFMDLLVSGREHGDHEVKAKIYRTIEGRYLSPEAIELAEYPSGSDQALWGDLEGDGDLDVLLAGSAYGEGVALYRNEVIDGERQLIPMTPAKNRPHPQGRWADVDLDGDLDPLMSDGSFLSVFLTGARFLFDPSQWAFSHGHSLSVESAHRVAWDDYDGDGDPDALLNDGARFWLLQNNFTRGVAPAISVPTELSVQHVSGTVVLSWKHEGEGRGRHFDVRVGTAPGSADIVPSQSWATRGNVDGGTELSLPRLPASGVYYWSVQAVDSVGNRSTPSEEMHFDYMLEPGPPVVDTLSAGAATGGGAQAVLPVTEVELRGVVQTHGWPTEVWFEWGEGDAFDHASERVVLAAEGGVRSVRHFVEGLRPHGAFAFRLVAENAAGLVRGEARAFRTSLFAPVESELPKDADYSDWADFDGDGDMDVVLSDWDSRWWGGDLGRGSVVVDTGNLADARNQIYENLGEGAFQLYQNINRYEAKWVDHNRDGFFEVETSGGEFRDFDGDGVRDFVDGKSIGLTAPRNASGSVERVWIDFDPEQTPRSFLDSGAILTEDLNDDGLLDFVTNTVGGVRVFFTVRLSDSENHFGAARGHVWDFETSTGAAGDWDGDGLEDVVLVNYDAAMGSTGVQFHRNEGGEGFTLLARIPLSDPSEYFEKLHAADFDGDGDDDLLGLADGRNIVFFENLLEQGLVRRGVNAAVGERESSFDMVDLDGDGDLDLYLGGHLFRNETSLADHRPLPPDRVTLEWIGDRARFEWSEGGDDTTPTPALTYSLSVFNRSTGRFVVLPDATDEGVRRVAGGGNMGHRRLFETSILTEGHYVWQVQSVDAAFQGSAFSEKRTFVVGDPGPVEAIDSDRDGVSDGDEMLAGTDVEDPLSTFALMQVTTGQDGTALSWNSEVGVVYTVEFSPVIAADTQWESLGRVRGDGRWIRFLDEAPARLAGGAGFYRLRVDP